MRNKGSDFQMCELKYDGWGLIVLNVHGNNGGNYSDDDVHDDSFLVPFLKV